MTAHRASSIGLASRGSTTVTRANRWESRSARAQRARIRGDATSIAFDPLIRTIATALSPTGVATAAIVSPPACRPSGPSGVLHLAAGALGSPGPIHVDLLEDLQHVAQEPVKHEARGHVQEHEREDEGHEQHHLRLARVASRRCLLLLHEHRDAHEDRQDIRRIVPGEVTDPKILTAE